MNIKIISLWILVISTCALASEPPLQREEFSQIQNVCEQIISKYPPEEYYYLGLGRSPVPVMAYLQCLQPSCASNLPLTNFRFGRPFNLTLFPYQKEMLMAHFDLYFPSSSIVGGRKFLLIDYCIRGNSLLAAKDHIKEYFVERKLEFSLEILALHDESTLVSEISAAERISTDGLDIVCSKWRDQMYDSFSEFGRFVVGCDPVEKKGTSRKYLQFKREIKGYLGECEEEKHTDSILSRFQRLIHKIVYFLFPGRSVADDLPLNS